MSAQLQFIANGYPITGGSGLGGYGDAGFGASVPVGSYQGHTFITSPDGTSLGQEVNNVKWLNQGSGILGQVGSGIGLRAIPNSQATLQVRFTNDTPVRTQNAKLYGYDRYSINNAPSGAIIQACNLIHPDPVQNNNGSGDTLWTSLSGTGSVLSCPPSPGVSGLYAGNGNDGGWTDTVHDFFFGLSLSANSIGSKTQLGLYFAVEYL